MQTTLYVEPTNVEVRHYDGFSVVEIAHGVTAHFSGTLDGDGVIEDDAYDAAEAFAQRITTPNTPALDMWLNNVDVRIDGVGTLTHNPLTKDNR